MTVFEDVKDLQVSPKRLSFEEAEALRVRLIGERPKSVLEVCQDTSEITLYLAACLEDQGEGSLTTFQSETTAANQRIRKYMLSLGIAGRVSSIPDGRSYTWAMQRLLAQDEPPIFDICALNGNKTWDALGFSSVLANMLLRRGGLMVLFDLHWSMATSPYFKQRPHLTEKFGRDQVEAQPVQRITEMLLPQMGYEILQTPELQNIAIARKR